VKASSLLAVVRSKVGSRGLVEAGVNGSMKCLLLYHPWSRPSLFAAHRLLAVISCHEYAVRPHLWSPLENPLAELRLRVSHRLLQLEEILLGLRLAHAMASTSCKL
jgi:hypothetical protein